MKVVLFCGGFGMRIRDYSENIPKPLVPIGYRPILWHVMKYYAHYGHKDFILCLGWKANVIKDYFLNYDECVSNDFTLLGNGKGVELMKRDIDDWRITFVDTGNTSSIGERLKKVQPLLEGEKHFYANYTDGLSDVDLDEMTRQHVDSNALATFLSVRPTQSFHTVAADESGSVNNVKAIAKQDVWMNGGFFVFSTSFFDHLNMGEEIIDEPFQRLIQQRSLRTYRHHGFWSCMDTYKEMQALEEMYERGNTPWAIWDSKENPNGAHPPAKRFKTLPR